MDLMKNETKIYAKKGNNENSLKDKNKFFEPMNFRTRINIIVPNIKVEIITAVFFFILKTSLRGFEPPIFSLLQAI